MLQMTTRSAHGTWPWLPFRRYRTLFLWLPLSVIVLQLLARELDTGQGFYLRYVESEHGAIENVAALMLLLAAIIGAANARRFKARGERELASWYILVAFLAALFFAEEISWGQHWIGWETPEFFQERNVQKETNLHNFSKPLERTLKWALAIAVGLGGILTPLVVANLGPERVPVRWRWVLPTFACLPTAVMAVILGTADRVRYHFYPLYRDVGPPWDVELKETFEFYLALFFLVYMVDAWRRLRQASTMVGAG